MAEGHDCRANMRRTVATGTTTQATLIPLAVLREICYITNTSNTLLLLFSFLIHIQKHPRSHITKTTKKLNNLQEGQKNKPNLDQDIKRKSTTQPKHKMKFSALTFIALAASSVYGSVIDVAAHDAAETYVDLETRATCWQSDMQAIKDRINHYNVFCQAFLLRYVYPLIIRLTSTNH